ncbi:Caspase Nc [Papilio machaon]|uniref:Caspase Nc n=1 Tax=Papilio machaon TaxID=76193 RepID=A0A0N1I6J1_PAPMA|nr:Caspase Nc [Papilio machaon]
MQNAHRKAIQNNFGSLVEQTDLDVMVSALYEKGVFSEQMIEPFKDTNKDTRTRKRQLYMDIMRRGPDAFGHLLEALEENGYWNLVRDLDPASSLHLQPRNTYNNQDSKSGESNYVSIRTEKKRTKSNVEATKNEIQAASSASHKEGTDPSVEIPYFHVVKSRQFFEDNVDKDIKLYKTRGHQRGILVIFSYIQFCNDIEKYRKGVDIDCKKLKYLFDEIGFSVIAYQNLTKQETETTLKRLEEVLVGTECVFIVVSSHGYERAPRSADTDIRCSDGHLLSFLDIVERFNNANLPALRGVPKVFISQLCRGRNEEWTLVPRRRAGGAGDAAGAAADGAGGARGPHGARVESDGARWEEPLERQPDRIYSDILIAHSTVPGFVSHRDPEKGSWYIQALCEVFAARAHDCHVEKLFTLVDERMYDHFQVQTSSVEKWGFNRRLYLHPGLYED